METRSCVSPAASLLLVLQPGCGKKAERRSKGKQAREEQLSTHHSLQGAFCTRRRKQESRPSASDQKTDTATANPVNPSAAEVWGTPKGRGFWSLFLTASLSSPRIWFIPPSAQAGMNRSLGTCVPLVSKGERWGEEWSKRR